MLLGLAIGALETMPDRGELLDWFGATEIIAEAVIAAFAFYLFMERGPQQTYLRGKSGVSLVLMADVPSPIFSPDGIEPPSASATGAAGLRSATRLAKSRTPCARVNPYAAAPMLAPTRLWHGATEPKKI